MYTRGGLHTFFKGCFSTAKRDMVFGVIYEPVRRIFRKSLLPNEESPQRGLRIFVSNSSAAFVATIASGPFNYTRGKIEMGLW